MKREIKFRGKRVDDKEWVEGSFGILGEDTDLEKSVIIVSTLDTNLYVDRFYFTDVEVTRESVGQFTGLKDKNGVEIYEGDIIRYYQPHSKTFHTHIVRWDDLFACFGLFKQDSKWCVESDWLKIKEIEVVGNIHDNPELLKLEIL